MSRRTNKRRGEHDEHIAADHDDHSIMEDDDEMAVQKAKKRRGRPAEEDKDITDDPLMHELMEQYNRGRSSEIEELPPERERSSSAGIISRIYVENFMCHRKFGINLCQHLNFITGRNGSGKSAIAAAIQICLGASAKTAGRGSYLGAVIREGSDGPAIVDVTLINEGDDAYQPNIYGKRITIRRKIPRSGGASYHILDEKGHVS